MKVSRAAAAVAITELVVLLGILIQNLSGCDAQGTSCDISTDTCPFQYDGICDSDFGSNQIQCQEGDCYDCDPCRNFRYDCTGCIENGCLWCPGDLTCYGNVYDFTQLDNKVPSCIVESDYVDSCTDPDNFFNDPLYSGQNWVYEQINLLPVWEDGITGTGIRIRVNDVGVDPTHPEFANRFDITASCSDFAPPDDGNFHGTAVASIAAGAADNDECAVGIAPGSTISSCYAFTAIPTFLNDKVDMFDISQNSFGIDACKFDNGQNRRLQTECPFTHQNSNLAFPCDVCDFTADSKTEECVNAIINHCFAHYEDDPMGCLEFVDLFLQGGRCNYNTLSPASLARLMDGIVQGRDGKGIVFLFASGNAFKTGEDVNFEGYLNTRFTISVGAVGKDGLHASYSTSGAALFVSAPGGDIEDISSFITAINGGGCTNGGFGTSFSCPVVAGVVALMLEVNPDLGWRDVQGILATTSRIVDNDPDDTTLTTNGAGITHSNLYGFGIVDAAAAVNAAGSWEIYEEEAFVVGESGPVNQPIPDAAPITSTVSITSDPDMGIDDFITESVVVLLTLRHASRGDLDITLTSPDGTESLMHPGNRPENTQLGDDEQWKLMTVRSWGESAIGDWTLTINDISDGDVSECVDAEGWQVTFNGDPGWTCFWVDFYLCTDGMKNTNNDYFDEEDTDEFFEVTDENGLTASDACCSCGGGISSSEVIDELLMWRMVVTGRAISSSNEIDSTDTQSPSIAPSPTGTVPPSVTLSPTSTPTIAVPLTEPPTTGEFEPTDPPQTVPTTAPPSSTGNIPTDPPAPTGVVVPTAPPVQDTSSGDVDTGRSPTVPSFCSRYSSRSTHCIVAGCFWCPEDKTCRTTPNIFSSCYRQRPDNKVARTVIRKKATNKRKRQRTQQKSERKFGSKKQKSKIKGRSGKRYNSKKSYPRKSSKSRRRRGDSSRKKVFPTRSTSRKRKRSRSRSDNRRKRSWSRSDRRKRSIFRSKRKPSREEILSNPFQRPKPSRESNPFQRRKYENQ